MPTVAQISQEINNLINEWEQKFTPLIIAVNFTKGDMSKRIFGDKSSGGKNANGDVLPTKPYSTEPIYVDVRSLPNTPASFQVGKRGKKIKSAYFPKGYSQLKQAVGRPPLELTGSLDRAFRKGVIVEESDSVLITIDDSEAGKVDGLEKKYGSIFEMTQEEEERFLQALNELIIEGINKAIS